MARPAKPPNIKRVDIVVVGGFYPLAALAAFLAGVWTVDMPHFNVICNERLCGSGFGNSNPFGFSSS